jgi:hypothetical protein
MVNLKTRELTVSTHIDKKKSYFDQNIWENNLQRLKFIFNIVDIYISSRFSVPLSKDNNKITELRTILQRECQNS